MKLQAQLTVGWNDDPKVQLAASELHKAAMHANEEYAKALATALNSADNAQLTGLEHLFRRRTGGFEKIKRFVGALASIPRSDAYPDPLVCRIDAFAYAFLKGAKNFDFVLPLGDAVNSDFRKTYAAWSRTITALENFERVGKRLPKDAGVSADQYVALRSIVSRSSARDERRALGTLLVSGPSTMEDISKDLGLNYSLSQRTVTTFETMGTVERRSGGIFAVAKSALPLVVFGLRESMGLDLLSSLPKED